MDLLVNSNDRFSEFMSYYNLRKNKFSFHGRTPEQIRKWLLGYKTTLTRKLNFLISVVYDDFSEITQEKCETYFMLADANLKAVVKNDLDETTIFRILNEVDACIKTVCEILYINDIDKEFTTDKINIVRIANRPWKKSVQSS